MPTVFVLMPLSEEFSPVYTAFIKPVMEGAGFAVRRADDIQSTQNILRDIFEAIVTSDLIVADLTGSNANVFYELGFAHAARKPVILLTQIIDDVPFDLQAYRLIQYDTYFTEIGKAKQALTDHAKKFLEGTLPTRDPVTDFFPGEQLPVYANDAIDLTAVAEPGDQGDGNPPGFLDSVVEAEDHFNNMVDILKRVDSSMMGMSAGAADATKDFERINANPNQSSARAARNVCRRLGSKIGAFNDVLKPANTEFAETMNQAQESTEAILAFQGKHIEETGLRVAEQRDSLQSLVDAGTGALDSLNSLISLFKSLPRMERRLDRQMQTGIDELYRMAGNFSRLMNWGSAAVGRMDAMLELQEGRDPG